MDIFMLKILTKEKGISFGANANGNRKNPKKQLEIENKTEKKKLVDGDEE